MSEEPRAEKKNKGFAGLSALVSDEIANANLADDPEPSGSETPAPKATSEPSSRSSPPSSSGDHSGASQTAQTQNQKNPPNPISGAIPWIVGGIAFLIMVVLVSSGKRQEVVPYAPSVPAAEKAPLPLSKYAKGIADLTGDQDRLIIALLTAGQGGDLKEIEAAAGDIDKAALPAKSVLDKATVKESRAMNKLGLQAHKEGNDGLAANQFFDAYKLNPYDTEIADNLGYVLYALADFQAAQKAYFASLLQSSRRASAWAGLAKVFAATNSGAKAAGSFALAFSFSKSPKTLRQTLLTAYREEKNLPVKSAIGSAMATHYSLTVADFLRPVLGAMTSVEIPFYLPTAVAALDYERKPITLFAQTNEVEATPESYRIPIASEPDCSAMYCKVGEISARKTLPSDLDEGDPVDLFDGLKGTIIKAVYRDSDHLVFRVGEIRYLFSLGSDVSADVKAANSALRLGAIPTEILSSIPKQVAAALPQPVPEVLPQTAPSQPPVYVQPANDPYCNTTYSVALETFGEGVTVELRFGSPGSSAVIQTAQSSGGNVLFDGLCAGTYFLAIGNNDSVSVTPVRNFESNMQYRSSIRTQRGSGNVTSKRRNEL